MKGGKRLVIGVLALAGVLAASSYASPWWRLHQLSAAVAERDAARVGEYVDFPVLRENVKAQLLSRMGASDSAQANNGNPLGGLARAVAVMAINPMVDAMVSPAGVTAMLEAGEVRMRRRPAAETPASDQDRKRYTLSYRSWDRVAIEGKEHQDGDGAFILHRHGLWSWKLGSIELPRSKG